jgi:hypothetical protein
MLYNKGYSTYLLNRQAYSLILYTYLLKFYTYF